MTTFLSSNINAFHPNTQQIDAKQNLEYNNEHYVTYLVLCISNSPRSENSEILFFFKVRTGIILATLVTASLFKGLYNVTELILRI